jgi:hypothetical protein
VAGEPPATTRGLRGLPGNPVRHHRDRCDPAQTNGYDFNETALNPPSTCAVRTNPRAAFTPMTIVLITLIALALFTSWDASESTGGR